MGTPFLGEIRLMSFNFAPKGWATCNGQFMPINQNQALFSLLGTNYGGNGQTTFALPDMRGRVPIHMGPSFFVGQRAGSETHTLTISELPAHTHALNGIREQGDSPLATGSLFAAAEVYGAAGNNHVALAAATITHNGSSQPHTNIQPSLVLNFCIALQGIFPSQN